MSKASPYQISRIKVGLAAFCAGWFVKVGLKSDTNELGMSLRRDYANIVGFLKECFDDVITPGVISTVEEAGSLTRLFQKEEVDAVLVVHILWSEDQPLVSFLDKRPAAPVFLWNYHPTGCLPRKLGINDLFRFSGTVGLLQGSAPMQKRNIKPLLIAGVPGDPFLRKSLQEYEQALKIDKALTNASIGRLGGPCECMTGTYVDKHALSAELGTRLIDISVSEYVKICTSLKPEQIGEFHAKLLGMFPVRDVSKASLRLACRNTLALDVLVRKHDLSALAIQDLNPELHRLAGVRPCLCPPLSAASGVAVGMEADVNTTLGMLAAMHASGGPCLFTEIFTYDSRENTFLMGHAGVHDPRLASREGVVIVPDAEYRHSDRREGAWQEFILKKGPVTCVSLYDTDAGYRMTVFDALSLGPPKKLEGFAHAVVRLNMPVAALISRLTALGMTQHFAVARGHISSILEKWATISGIQFIRI